LGIILEVFVVAVAVVNSDGMRAGSVENDEVLWTRQRKRAALSRVAELIAKS
jgi:hypothetical protein